MFFLFIKSKVIFIRSVIFLYFQSLKINHLFKFFIEYFRYDLWLDAFRDCGIDPDFYTVRGYGEDELLCWDHIDVGVTKRFLKLERKRAYEGRITPDCREGCAGCGANKLLKEVPCDA